MKVLKLLFLIIVIPQVAVGQIQNQCAFDEVRFENQNDSQIQEQRIEDIRWWNYWRNKYPNDAHIKTRSLVETRSSNCKIAKMLIPLAIHVVHDNGPEKIDSSQIYHSVDALNYHFANDKKSPSPAVNTGI